MAKVLIATDGSDFATESAARALELIGGDHDITVISVVSPVLPTTVPVATLDAVPAMPDPETEARLADEQKAQAQYAVDQIARLVGTAPALRVDMGDPADVICRVAAEDGFDLIVIGSHGHGWLQRVLIGSTSNHVMHHAPCPVLVMRRPEEAEG
jgi:nucleotide-binding universal stress UspA family protein